MSGAFLRESAAFCVSMSLEFFHAQPWACEPNALRRIAAIANREQADPALAAAIREAHAARPMALATREGRPLDGTSAVTVRDGVAIIPIVGPIMRYASLFSAVSGVTSLQTLATDVTIALNNPSVSGILLSIDSPGGQVTGLANFAAMLYAARTIKPIETYAEGMCASAAYWIAAATRHITIERTAEIGSVGVVVSVPDPTKTTSRELTFVSSQSPRKRLDAASEDGRNHYQQLADDTAAVFVEAVATYRDLTVDQVVSDFAEGGTLIGQRAVAAGMVDSLGTFEEVVQRMSQERFRRMVPPRQATGALSAFEDRLRRSFYETK